GGTLAGRSRPGDQHNAVAKVGYICEVRGQMQGDELGNSGRDDAHDDGATAALDKGVHAEAGKAGEPIGDVARTLFAERVDGLLVVADQVGGDAPGIVRSERGESLNVDRHQLAVDLHL